MTVIRLTHIKAEQRSFVTRNGTCLRVWEFISSHRTRSRWASNCMISSQTTYIRVTLYNWMAFTRNVQRDDVQHVILRSATFHAEQEQLSN